MSNTYNEPISRLFTLGPVDWDEWEDYSHFGFSQEHVPDLIRLGTDRHLLTTEEDVSDDELWAPMHAWRALVQMFAIEAIEPLIQVFDLSEEVDTDLVNEGLTDALETFGQPVLEPLFTYINQPGHTGVGYINAADVMSRIGEKHPEIRERVVNILTSVLANRFHQNDEDINGFLIANLLDLHAVESYPAIKQAFEAGKVNPRIAGDLEDVELEFGMREKRDTPPPNKPLTPALFRSLQNEFKESLLDPQTGEGVRKTRQLKKEKSKRKAEKKSRKKNRKRK